MERLGQDCVPDVLATLEELDDEELRAVQRRVQELLLDRPIPPTSTPMLAVEIVDREESRLLAAYRTRSPLPLGLLQA